MTIIRIRALEPGDIQKPAKGQCATCPWRPENHNEDAQAVMEKTAALGVPHVCHVYYDAVFGRRSEQRPCRGAYGMLKGWEVKSVRGNAR